MAKKVNTQNEINDYLNERVAVTLKRPESEKKEFRTVSVNGVNFQIEYGKTVMVPRYIADVIKESEKNEQIAKDNADKKAEEFAMGKSSLEG